MLNIDGIGRLTKRIEVLAYQDIESNGITKQKLVRLIPNRIWARIEPLRGRQYLEMFKEKCPLFESFNFPMHSFHHMPTFN